MAVSGTLTSVTLDSPCPSGLRSLRLVKVTGSWEYRFLEEKVY